jgi:hypothetical protein
MIYVSHLALIVRALNSLVLSQVARMAQLETLISTKFTQSYSY